MSTHQLQASYGIN